MTPEERVMLGWLHEKWPTVEHGERRPGILKNVNLEYLKNDNSGAQTKEKKHSNNRKVWMCGRVARCGNEEIQTAK